MSYRVMFCRFVAYHDSQITQGILYVLRTCCVSVAAITDVKLG